MKEKIIGYDVIDFLTKSIALRFKLNGKDFTHVIGIARGGMIPATMMSYLFNAKLLSYDVSSYEGTEQGDIEINQDIDLDSIDADSKVLVIDDICDSSKTMQHIKQKIGNTRYKSVRFVTLFARENTKHVVDHYGVTVKEGTWLVFPWEK
jgi:hypoxanthine phosphoribosyltransferase